MKKFVFNLVASFLVGAVSFGISLWFFGCKQNDALVLGFSVAVSGLTMEYFKLLLTKKKVSKIVE